MNSSPDLKSKNDYIDLAAEKLRMTLSEAGIEDEELARKLVIQTLLAVGWDYDAEVLLKRKHANIIGFYSRAAEAAALMSEAQTILKSAHHTAYAGEVTEAMLEEMLQRHRDLQKKRAEEK